MLLLWKKISWKMPLGTNVPTNCKVWYSDNNTNLKSDQRYEDTLDHPTLNTADATLPFLGEMMCDTVAAWW